MATVMVKSQETASHQENSKSLCFLCAACGSFVSK